MFKVNSRHGSGFVMSFNNGYSVSIQWSPGCHCTNLEADANSIFLSSNTAEVAVIFNGVIIGDVMKYRTPEQIATTIYNVSMNERNRTEVFE